VVLAVAMILQGGSCILSLILNELANGNEGWLCLWSSTDFAFSNLLFYATFSTFVSSDETITFLFG